MSQRKNLHDVKTTAEFENGYWYATELKAFAKEIGIANTSKLRKDQLEGIIKEYLQSGATLRQQSKTSRKTQRDTLDINTCIVHYVSDKKTKTFILEQAHKLCPDLPKKSGVWYWTNRWREEQLEHKVKITYQQLIAHFVKLSTQEGRLPQIPSARFNNFITDFLAAGEGDREQAKAAWGKLKSLDIPKTYAAWKEHNAVL